MKNRKEQKRVLFIFALFAMMICSSCGIFRDIKKDKYQENTKLLEQINSSENNIQVSYDQGVSVTERNTISTINTPGLSLHFQTKLDRLFKGETVTQTDSSGATISVKLTDNNQNLDIKVQGVPKTETIVTYEKTTDFRDKLDSINRTFEQMMSIDFNSKVKQANVEKEGKNSFWFAIIVLGIVAVVGLIVYLIKKFK